MCQFVATLEVALVESAALIVFSTRDPSGSKRALLASGILDEQFANVVY